MEKRKRTRRRRRRSRSLAGLLLPMPAILLISVMLAAALSPHSPAGAKSTGDTQADHLTEQLAGSVTPDAGTELLDNFVFYQGGFRFKD